MSAREPTPPCAAPGTERAPRAARASAPQPHEDALAAPATRAALARATSAIDAGADYKTGLEQFLLELDEERADALMLLLEEGRGAWLPLLEGSGGRALFLGNALSGTVPALALAGWRVTVLDASAPRLAFGERRNREYVPGATRAVRADGSARLPFHDGVFELVVAEDGPALADPARAELARLAAGELLVVAANRLAYKRSSGRRGRFRLARPAALARALLAPPPGERTLAGHRRPLAARFERVRAFALYPHALEFSHVVALDAPWPRLSIGPKERRNVAKMAALKLGLFPALAPSFAFLCARGAARAPRLERLLDALAERLGEPRPRAEILVATRSNTALVHTLPEQQGGARAEDEGEVAGRWTLHVPLSPRKRALLARHMAFLRRVRADFPGVPVPEALFEGEIEGLWLSCERRLGGLTAPQHTGERAPTRRMFAELAGLLPRLLLGPPEVLDEAGFAASLGARFDLVARHAAVPATVRELARMRESARERLVGRSFPWSLHHADLRAKHVQVRRDGSVLGLLDWGASEERFLPYVDLLHLVAHQRKQEEGGSPARSWRLVRERTSLREHERAALDGYAAACGLDDELRRVLEEIYPVLVAGMAERNWDYSRPRWIHREFGI